MKRFFTPLVLLLASVLNAFAGDGSSVYTTRIEDPAAVYLTGAVGDGLADDTAAIQAAIDQAYAARRAGIVFIPEGRYRLTQTIHVPPAVRVIGWGAKRPVFLLADNTPGYASGMAYLVMFVGGPASQAGPPIPPAGNVPPSTRFPDANAASFYSAMSNINFEIGAGNAGAVALRFHGAQHNFLTHMDFHIGSGLAAIHHLANELEDLRFFGGRYGILAEKPSPAWPVTLIDSEFDGQRDAAIREHELSLTLVNVAFRNTPVGIEIDRDYADWLWAKNTRFENISRAAVIISMEKNPLNQISFEDAVVSNVPVFALYRETGRTVGRPGAYHVKNFNHGLILETAGRMGEIGTRFAATPLAALPPPLPRAIRALPPTDQWVNVRTLGVKGDGQTDDTAALRDAIARHRTLYFPIGHYVVTDTIELKPDTVIVGLHPSLTSLDIPDLTPAYQGIGAPRPLLATPPGGENIVSGIALFPGGLNPLAVAAFWQAGERSLLNDVYFAGGHGTNGPMSPPNNAVAASARGATAPSPAAVPPAAGRGVGGPAAARWSPYNENRTGDSDPRKRWDGQYPSLWVTNGGGGTFTNFWVPTTYAQAGVMITDTKTPGYVYQLSCEHHGRNEIVLRNVENWSFYGPQTEEESGESREAISFEIQNSRNITIANLHAYRVTRSLGPMDTAVRIFNSSNIRFRNFHSNAESGLGARDQNGVGTHLRLSRYPFENAIRDATHHVDVREREFAVLDFNPAPKPTPIDMGARVRKLEEGFYSITGAVADANGKLYFADRHQQRIYGWSEAEGLTVERDNPFDPVNLALDRSGNLLVFSSLGAAGTVYTFKPGTPATTLTVISPTPATVHPRAAFALPVNFWYNGEFKDQHDPATLEFTTLGDMFKRELGTPKAKEYVSPDGSLVIPAWRTFQQGTPDYRGWRFSENLNTYGYANAQPGERIHVIHSSEARTYSGRANADGTVSDLKLFADRGGESLAVDGQGNVYIANGQIFVYSKTGQRIGQIDVPERPIQVIVGGADKRTLFILAHHALYAVKI